MDRQAVCRLCDWQIIHEKVQNFFVDYLIGADRKTESNLRYRSHIDNVEPHRILTSRRGRNGFLNSTYYLKAFLWYVEEMLDLRKNLTVWRIADKIG